jgi:tRNA(adenine34) deaminase
MGEKQFSERDDAFMRLAIEEAHKAEAAGDIPVGAILVDHESGEIIARGYNTREVEQNALGHAEINVIEDACRETGSWRLGGTTLYVTLEPCPMCAGAIVNARIPRVVYGASDPTVGAMGSVWNLSHHPAAELATANVSCGCLEDECKTLMADFLKNKRIKK